MLVSRPGLNLDHHSVPFLTGLGLGIMYLVLVFVLNLVPGGLIGLGLSEPIVLVTSLVHNDVLLFLCFICTTSITVFLFLDFVYLSSLSYYSSVIEQIYYVAMVG
jgi:hypothetical protein